MWFIFFLLVGLAGLSTIVFLVLTIIKKKLAWIGLVASLGVGAVATILLVISLILSTPNANPTVASTDNSNNSNEVTETSEEPVAEKTLDLNEEFMINELSVTVNTVEITEDDVKVSLTIVNDSDNSKSFYPDQSDIVIGNTQISANAFMTKGDVSGDIHSGVEKSGTIRFPSDAVIDVEEVTEMRLKLGNIYDDTTHETEEFDEVINVE